MTMPRYYVITYISAVTGNARSTSCGTLEEARKEKRNLEKEGCKNVNIVGLRKEK